MKKLINEWRKFLKEDYDERMYEFRASLIISKDVGGDKSQTFSEIRAIAEIVTLKQEPDSAEENESDYFSEINIGPYKADFWRLCILYINGGGQDNEFNILSSRRKT